MRCIICGVNETDGRNNYCSECYSEAVGKLDEKYGRREASTPWKEEEALSASEPLTERTR